MSEENNWKEAYKQQQQRASDAQQKTAKSRPIIQKDPVAPYTPASTAETVQKVIFAILIGSSVIQCFIWTIICIASGQLTSPWWLWSTIPSLLIMGIVWTITHKK